MARRLGHADGGRSPTPWPRARRRWRRAEPVSAGTALAARPASSDGQRPPGNERGTAASAPPVSSSSVRPSTALTSTSCGSSDDFTSNAQPFAAGSAAARE